MGPKWSHQWSCWSSSPHVNCIDNTKNIFNTDNNCIDNGLDEEVIPNLITNTVNNMLTLIPTLDEIHSEIFSMNKDRAPGPDGFGAYFYQTYWEIISLDVSNAVKEFFSSGCQHTCPNPQHS